MSAVTNRSKQQSVQLSGLPVAILMVISSLLLIVDLVVSSSLTSFLVLLLSLTGTTLLICKKELNGLFNWMLAVNRRYRIHTVLFVIVGVIFLGDCMATPASAQFFTQTEGWMRNSFPMTGGAAGGGTDIYALVFNTLRAIFVLYLAISLVRVIAAARNDEDWQNLARTPLIILITVTLGDILAGLITGGGGGAA